ncbi:MULTISPECIES: GNAT family N-acetyltransferase [Actinoplanes]|uniref:GNAT family N-acetyltransferase n=1 Tax=Actinoplanes TaxID=1865 RepID=UPI0005F29EB0|nr:MULTISPECIES: GNAT family N-acetyltransferase [Actinoplanes]GLY06182.1 N-acetyltransferase [Actinoplanes sp. NBRC 101535]
MSDYQVLDNAAEHRFELVVDGEVGALATYHVRDGVLIILHTETAPEKRGQGLAGRLAAGTLEIIRGRGQKVVPACPYFARYIEEYPQYADLVARS